MGFKWSLLFVLAFISVHAAQDLPEGFINIDCGASEDTISPWSQLKYKSDKDIISSGINKPISPQYRTSWDQLYWTLRSFPNGTRNCYHLKLDLEASGTKITKKHLVRAAFAYGNYDGLNFTSSFDLYFGANFWATMFKDRDNLEVVTFLDDSTEYVDVCLVNTDNGVPYISFLDFRPLEFSLYQTDARDSAKLLVLWGRFHFGGNLFVRYPEDKYDRMWYPTKCNTLGNTTTAISTNATVADDDDGGGGGDSYKLPRSVLQTACKAANSSLPLQFKWTNFFKDSRYYLCFHFAEIERLRPGQIREMRIVLNDEEIVASSIKLSYLKPYSFCSKGLDLVLYRENVVSVSSSSSSMPPVLNGFEVYYTRNTSNPITFGQDVNAIGDIKQHYKLSRNWEGDPCEPLSFSWEGLNCSNANPWPRIISLNLSSSNLTGDIAYSISMLTAINNLDLSYNELEGAVPEFLAQLPELKLVNLSGNKLTGVIPNTLLQKAKDGTLVLSVEGNPKLCSSPSCNHKRELAIPIPVFCSVTTALVLLFLLGIITIYKRKSIGLIKKGALELNPRYSYKEIVSITESFRMVIGEGGFGKVYLGALKDQTVVAVKVLSSSSQQGYKEFQAEAQLLMVLHHRNLVCLVGYCDEGDHKALIYEYMANGNLHQYLTDTSRNIEPLSWVGRLQIAVDVAQGLEYLHNGCKPSIIHRDLKPANILLDKTMQAKIADFGLSRTFATEDQSQLVTRLAGTLGYLDPGTQAYCGNVNKQSDVYSFGIIVLELITGHPVITKSAQENVHILSWVEPLINMGDIHQIIDLKLGGEFNQNSAWKILELVMSCTQPTSLQRPDMSYVLAELKGCLAVHQTHSAQTSLMSTRILSQSEIAPSPRLAIYASSCRNNYLLNSHQSMQPKIAPR